MRYIDLADIFLNLDQVAFIRREEHAHLGTVVAIHFAEAGLDPLYVGEQHHEELRRRLPLQDASAAPHS